MKSDIVLYHCKVRNEENNGKDEEIVVNERGILKVTKRRNSKDIGKRYLESIGGVWRKIKNVDLN